MTTIAGMTTIAALQQLGLLLEFVADLLAWSTPEPVKVPDCRPYFFCHSGDSSNDFRYIAKFWFIASLTPLKTAVNTPLNRAFSTP